MLAEVAGGAVWKIPTLDVYCSILEIERLVVNEISITLTDHGPILKE
jgi:hypothetical protein